MINNNELLEMYNAIQKPEEEKHRSLCRVYDIIDQNLDSNVMDTMANELGISVHEWRVYRSIVLRVMKGKLKFEGLS